MRRAAFARARDLPAAARTAAPPSGLVAWSSPRSGVVARAELKSGGEGRYVRPVEDKSPMKDEEIYFDPADLDLRVCSPSSPPQVASGNLGI